MDRSSCSEAVKKLLKEPGILGFYQKINLRRRFRVTCEDCSKHPAGSPYGRCRGYFDAPHIDFIDQGPSPRIVICSDKLERGEHDIRELLRHELVHAYDHCVLRRDLTECEPLACSEVRAAREGECRLSFFGDSACSLAGLDPSELMESAVPASAIGKLCLRMHKRCVEENARRSVTTVYPKDGKRCLRAVFDQCYEDQAGKR